VKLCVHLWAVIWLQRIEARPGKQINRLFECRPQVNTDAKLYEWKSTQKEFEFY